jgi:Spy/CpxP family protein refolding chaperone
MSVSELREKGRMMNKRWILIVAVVTLLCAAIASAQPAPGTQPQRAGRAAALAEYLQLTPEQITAAKQLHSDTAAAMKPLVQNAQGLRKQLDAAMSATSPDPAAIGKLALALRTARADVRSARQASEAKFVAMLTPDQKVKFDAFQAAAGFRRHRGQGAMGMAPR